MSCIRFLLFRSVFAICCIPLLVILALSCNHDLLNPDPDALPGFSTDTVSFDTVFTTIGSATLYFKVYNKDNRPLLIRSIELGGGNSSFFRLNIDGEPALRVTDVEIAPKDSMFIFVAITIDPLNSNNPVIISDSVVFNTNGTLQHVKLLAYGQDVHLYKNTFIGTETWINDKPYLVYGNLEVDSGHVLTIEPGAQIYFHRNSSMVVWGTLVVNGTSENCVVFQNDRLEAFYDIIPGQWGTIFFAPYSRGNRINHAIIRNSIAGLQLGFPADPRIPELEISNSIIQNMSFAGIYAFGAELLCYNTVIANCAGPAAALLQGGNYEFYHCTISNNGVLGTSRSSPSLVMTNYFDNIEEGAYVRYTRDLTAGFVNSIIYGSNLHELQLLNSQASQFIYRFDHCLLKASADSIDLTNTAVFSEIILNRDPNFANDSDRYHLNYSLDTLSPAKDSGDAQLIEIFPYLEYDIMEQSRKYDGKPDLGAFERKED
ncbi:MAG: right-handed parallel beta-helix repeat-containing protein [Bacteroidales bacterium]|nr:right-handed parallel beta-helix repeat-containing protein [Bacteroidales bacterium]